MLRMKELTFEHKKILEDLDHENRLEIEELKREEQDLFALSKALREQNLKERDQQDNDTWDILDRVRERNKNELAKIIEEGIQHSANLAVGKSKFKEAKKEKLDIERQIHTA